MLGAPVRQFRLCIVGTYGFSLVVFDITGAHRKILVFVCFLIHDSGINSCVVFFFIFAMILTWIEITHWNLMTPVLYCISLIVSSALLLHSVKG